MLILTRRIGENIKIGDNIILEVRGIQRNQVRFAIQAPKELIIFRGEFYQKSKNDYQHASPK